ncbi:MAG: HAMP domain-containing histidine kinase [Anaerolineales bacterium]|nr:HAMP domain-containing histidine kinase [Anaerolineales bacterium]
MSLRLRLTLLYSMLMGGFLLVSGVAVFFIINYIMLNQMDNMLAGVVGDIVKVTQVDSMGEINVMSLPRLDMNSNAYIQLWGRDGQLKTTSPTTGLLTESLDALGLQAVQPMYRDSIIQGVHLRVLSVPLIFGNRIIGVLQVAASMAVIDTTRRDLLSIMVAVAVISAVLAGVGSWLVLGQALSPLEAITDAVEQINRADDLSRRIPYRGTADDEVGDLIETFNQTLERLESLFTSQQRFIADVSHELRTPLTVIKGNVDLMRRMKKLDAESLSSIDQEAGRLTRLVGGLLLFAQAESGKLTLSMNPVELDNLLTEVFQEMRVLSGGKVQIKITEIDQILVNGDRDRLKQVLLNLVANAIQYTPQGGEVFMSLAKVGEQTRIIVRDTGPGIPPEDLPHIFDRFYRAEKSRTRGKATGFGLGLSIANWIVEHHGGQIKVESKEGKGTTFAIWLPLLQTADTSLTLSTGSGQ